MSRRKYEKHDGPSLMLSHHHTVLPLIYYIISNKQLHVDMPKNDTSYRVIATTIWFDGLAARLWVG